MTMPLRRNPLEVPEQANVNPPRMRVVGEVLS